MYLVDKLSSGNGLNVLYRLLVEEFESLCGRGRVAVFLHAPDEIPHIHYKYIELQLNEIMRISVKPKLTKISKEMENLTPKLYVHLRILNINS